MISPNSIHGGGISTPRCGASSCLSLALDAVFVLEDLLILTDLLMVLDATLFAAFALFAALFFSPAALLVAARVRGSAHPGLSPVVLPPLLPGFLSDGNSHCSGCCHDDFQSPGMMLDAMRRGFLLWAYLLAAMSFAVFEGAETKLPDHDAENDAPDDAFVVGAGLVWRTSSPSQCPKHLALVQRLSCTITRWIWLLEVRCGAMPTLLGLGMLLFFQRQKEDKEFSLEFFWECFSKRGKSWRLWKDFRE